MRTGKDQRRLNGVGDVWLGRAAQGKDQGTGRPLQGGKHPPVPLRSAAGSNANLTWGDLGVRGAKRATHASSRVRAAAFASPPTQNQRYTQQSKASAREALLLTWARREGAEGLTQLGSPVGIEKRWPYTKHRRRLQLFGWLILLRSVCTELFDSSDVDGTKKSNKG